MKFTKKELQKIVKAWNSLGLKGDALPILHEVKLTQQLDTRKVEISNLETEIIIEFQGESDSETTSFMVPVQIIKDTAKAMKAKDTADATGTEISFNGCTRTVQGMPTDEFPPIQETDYLEPIKDPQFIDKLENVMQASDPKSIKLQLRGTYIEPNRLVGTDGRRLHIAELPEDWLRTESTNGNPNFPNSAMKSLKLLDRKKIIQYHFDKDNKIYLSDGLTTIQVKSCEGIYPNYRQVIPDVSQSEKWLSLTADDLDKVAQIGKANKDCNKLVNFARFEGKVKAWKEGTEADLDNALLTTEEYIAVNWEFLRDAAACGVYKYRFSESETPFLGTSGDYTVVIMPGRSS